MKDSIIDWSTGIGVCVISILVFLLIYANLLLPTTP